jgi:hypothetical protein
LLVGWALPYVSASYTGSKETSRDCTQKPHNQNTNVMPVELRDILQSSTSYIVEMWRIHFIERGKALARLALQKGFVLTSEVLTLNMATSAIAIIGAMIGYTTETRNAYFILKRDTHF